MASPVEHRRAVLSPGSSAAVLSRLVGRRVLYRSLNGFDCEAEIVADHRDGMVDVNVLVPGGLVLPKVRLRERIEDLGRMEVMLCAS